MKKIIIPLLLISFNFDTWAQKMYKVDSSYGTNGISLTTPASGSVVNHIEMNAVHLQDDGKVWEGGRIFTTSSTYWVTTLQKRKANGTRDSSYSGDGIKTASYETNNQVLAMIPLKGDKMYAAVDGYGGYVARPDTAMISQVYNGMVVGPAIDLYASARYNDSVVISVGHGNIIWYKDNGIGTGPNNYANSGYTLSAGTYIGSEYFEHQQYTIAVQADGKYLVAGKFKGLLSYSKFGFIARYKAGYNFELDSTFGVNGVQTISPILGTKGTPYVACIAIEPSGSIIANVVATDSASGAAFGQQGMRFNANGTFRENFALPNARKLIVNSDGKIFALGNTGSVFCVNPDGSFYTNFFGGAKALDMAEFPSGAVGHVGRDMSMNASGDLIIVGYYNQSSTGTHSFTRKFTTYTDLTSIAERTLQNEVKIYPNPSDGLFTIDLAKSALLKVSNAMGQIVLQANYTSGQHQISLRDFSNGIYFVNAIVGNEQTCFKIVKQ